MASCGSVTPDNFDTSNAKWFKIDEQGLQANGTWMQNELYVGGVATVQLPKNIAAGFYLLRNEIIALHLATSLGGAEFYTGCVQLNIGGNENGIPPASDLVSIPGLYSDTDPGIYDPDVFNPGAVYTFPGPPVATLIGSGGSAPQPSLSTSQTSLLTPQPSPSPTNLKSCGLRRPASSYSSSYPSVTVTPSTSVDDPIAASPTTPSPSSGSSLVYPA